MKTCAQCGTVTRVEGFYRPRFCDPCAIERLSRQRWWVYMCGRHDAAAAVARAVADGRLQRLDGTVPCADCGKPARDYDHRDYNKPFEVTPVCRSCNILRGSAKPLDSFFPWPGFDEAERLMKEKHIVSMARGSANRKAAWAAKQGRAA